jgi:hypothetical protein
MRNRVTQCLVVERRDPLCAACATSTPHEPTVWLQSPQRKDQKNFFFNTDQTGNVFRFRFLLEATNSRTSIKPMDSVERNRRRTLCRYRQRVWFFERIVNCKNKEMDAKLGIWRLRFFFMRSSILSQ